MFHRTQSYTVHVKGDVQELKNIRFVREGFNLWAFMFGAFWAFYHRLWWVGAAVIALQAIAIEMVHQGLLSEAGTSAIQILLSFGLALFGNDMIRKRLQHAGFVFMDVVVADNETKATQRFLDFAAA
jgi:hypothetical protein